MATTTTTPATFAKAENIAVVSPPRFSKINWSMGVAAVVALLASFGYVIPPEWQEFALKVIAVGGPLVAMILRTWFTTKAVTLPVLKAAIELKKAA
jgi:hypothetical protein